MQNKSLELIRSLKGAPLSVLMVFAVLRVPLGHDYLVLATGWSKDKVTEALQTLYRVHGLLDPIPGERYCGWQLSARAKQLELFQSSPIIQDSPTTTTYLDINKQELKAVEVRESYNLGLDQLEVAEFLSKNGVRGNKVFELANMSHMKLDYVKAHFQYGRRRNDDLALIIHRLQSNDLIPGEQPRMLDSEGEYGAFILH